MYLLLGSLANTLRCCRPEAPSWKLHVAFLMKEDPWGMISLCSAFGGGGRVGRGLGGRLPGLSREGERVEVCSWNCALLYQQEEVGFLDFLRRVNHMIQVQVQCLREENNKTRHECGRDVTREV